MDLSLDDLLNGLQEAQEKRSKVTSCRRSATDASRRRPSTISLSCCCCRQSCQSAMWWSW
jgi:hypothetical protein